MTGNELLDAMSHIDPDLILQAEAPTAKKHRRPFWMAAAAAVLALAIGIGILLNPMTIGVKAVSTAHYPQYQWTYRQEMREVTESLSGFFQESMLQALSGSSGNTAYSPINLYLALCISGELTGGDSQILSLLGADSLEALRAQANQVWNACYYDNGDQTLLANSLWLDDTVRYDQAVMDTLAENYYTSVYHGDLGTDSADRAIRDWLNRQTGGLLREEAGSLTLDQDIVLALYSTVFYRAQWSGFTFSQDNNREGIFHAPNGDTNCVYMNKNLLQTYYYAGEDFGAIALELADGSQMWLVLPEEGNTTDDILASGQYASLLFAQNTDSSSFSASYRKVNLSLPKFDVRCSGDLKGDLQNMGITRLFDPENSGLSHSVTGEANVWLDAVSQATRVAIDEEGVTAASYIAMTAPGAPMPPEEIMDFILDRPFLFVITNTYRIPLFAGVVNDP